MSKPLLTVEHLKKYYTGRNGLFSGKQIVNRAVNDVSFTIPKGITVGLVGESGCGKSTVGKAVLNLISPTSGKVVYDDTVLYDTEAGILLSQQDMTKLRQRMQIIFQDPSSCLNPRKNVEQIISEGIRKHKICPKNEIRDHCIEIMEKCGLDRIQMMRYPHEFSGGQRQRIGIARALALHPEFVVCDEPTAALDVSIQSQILNLMLDMKEQFSLTYLFISHNMGVVEHFCDRIIIMYLGYIVEEGDCRQIYSNPLHPYTQLLMESVPARHPDQAKDRIVPQFHQQIATQGCPFAPRCPRAKDICYQVMPALKETETDHCVACHYLD